MKEIFATIHAMAERGRISKAMEKRYSLVLFSFALFIAFDPAIAAQLEAVSENGKPHIRKSSDDRLFPVNSTAYSTKQPSARSRPARRYPWKTSIVTTVFWIGEQPSGNNLVPNRRSSWDKDWSRSYGGFDDPNPAHRSNYVPVKFTPRQNPFYCALPYNDKAATGHRPEAPRVVPWFNEAYQGPGVSTCKDRWVAIRKGSRTVYAQWEDAGPFRTDYWQYVFGNERPKSTLNKGAGLDVSPAVRDCLGLRQTDVTDWRFVDFSEVPRGPWSTLGENNTFVINDRKKSVKVAEGIRRKKVDVTAR